MVTGIKQETIDFFLDMVRKYEPYPLSEYKKMISYFDGEYHDGDTRYAASICLQALVDMGFKEEDVNPWPKRKRDQG